MKRGINRFRMVPFWVHTFWISCFLAGCSASSDPTKDGLIGYWATGSDGYQARIDERRSALEELQRENEQQEAVTSQLSAALTGEQSRINQLQAEIEGLDAETSQLSKEVKTLAQKKQVSDVRLRVAQQRGRLEAMKKRPSSASQTLSDIESMHQELRQIKKSLGN